jgi:DNA-binding response OmpR family regulator
MGESELPLTHAQRLILAALIRRAGRVGRRWELYEEAFGRPLPTGSRAVDLHVARIRRIGSAR